MHKTISLFNHKGGVSKTTTTFGLGWMLAEKGHRVVMIDADPQCNLTGLVLGESMDDFYLKHPEQNIRDGLSPAFESQPREISAIDCVQVGNRKGLYLIPGHVNLSEYEVTLGIAQELSGSIQALRNLPGAFHYFVSKVAKANNADFVLIDMNPSLGAMNQNFLMSSDCFIVPTAPDYFSLMAIDSLTKILPRWSRWAERAHTSEALSNAAYPFPELKLKFLGTIIQKFRPRNGSATVGFQDWIDRINQRVIDSLVPALSSNGLMFPTKVYESIGVTADDGYCLSQIPDFNTLVATSQTHRTPVFALTDAMFGHVGKILEQDKIKRAQFRKLFDDMTDKVISLANNA